MYTYTKPLFFAKACELGRHWDCETTISVTKLIHIVYLCLSEAAGKVLHTYTPCIPQYMLW
jgi:hypothetical protein